MKASDLVLRCMSWKEGQVWVAVCLDLSLAAQGDSLAEATSKLDAQLHDYVVQALTVDSDNAWQLLHRHAPLLDRLAFNFWWWLDQNPSIRGAAASAVRFLKVATQPRRSYFEPLPMQPA